MRILLLSWLLLLFGGIHSTQLASAKCLHDQQSLLLQLKHTLQFIPSLSTRLIHWNQSTDCCGWNGVTCDHGGRVTGLDLNNEWITGGIHNSSVLFRFHFLQTLNLAFNYFYAAQIPRGFSNLTSLTYLNLSNSGFTGQIPLELSTMTNLSTLDLSSTFPTSLESPNFPRLINKLWRLTELHLDGVNISARGYEWCEAVSSSLPNLRVLSLMECSLSGPICSHLRNLRSLEVIDLTFNNLFTIVPEFFANFTNLKALHLSSCKLQGKFPEKIFQVPTLQSLDLSHNAFLGGSLPEFPKNGSLQTLVLSYTNFSGRLPNSIDSIDMLSRIEVVNCSFNGPLPISMANLTQLVYLDLSDNMFSGPIPSFRMSKNLIHIDLSSNQLVGPIPSTHFKGLSNLQHIDLRLNLLNGSIPSSLLALPSLLNIYLSFNQLGGQLDEFANASSSLLQSLDLGSNNLGGPIPMSLFQLDRLASLKLHSNNFSGSIKLETIYKLHNLTSLDLSYNGLTIDAKCCNSSFSSFPQLKDLSLASCRLKSFPDLRNQLQMYYLDLSNNQIEGEIPNWIWKRGDTGLVYLNLSHNHLTGMQKPYVMPKGLEILDLHSNQLHGKIPLPPESMIYLDFSSNNFNSSVPFHIGTKLSWGSFFSLSNNNLTGAIPESLCNISILEILDLSNNGFSGGIPLCLIVRSTTTLAVLNIGKNRLSGSLTGTFPRNCSLRTLDLNGNHLEGKIPVSLANCKMLEVLNLGNNKINDSFPCFLKHLSSLHVLVLRSNRFEGEIKCEEGKIGGWSSLQIIDIAFNNFGGSLPSNSFRNWTAMMVDGNNEQSQFNDLRFVFSSNNLYYQDKVLVTYKGLELELVKILRIFTTIDFSSNKFEGTISDALGNLAFLHVLNLSHNFLSGPIPPSFGRLKQLDSLDLSWNNLSGRIPTQLASLTFLSVLNLSYNLLVGRIPTGPQFQTFSDTSFQGNKALCGAPLNLSCSHTRNGGLLHQSHENKHSYFEAYVYVSAVVGFVMGLAFTVGPIVFSGRWRRWYYRQIDRFLLRNMEQRRRLKQAQVNWIRRLLH